METCDSQVFLSVILRASEGCHVEGHKKEKGTKSERRMPRLSGGDERRGKLRKAAGICKQDLIRGCLNGATHQVEDLVLLRRRANPGN